MPICWTVGGFTVNRQDELIQYKKSTLMAEKRQYVSKIHIKILLTNSTICDIIYPIPQNRATRKRGKFER